MKIKRFLCFALAGLFLFVSFFLFGGLALIGVAYAVQISKKKKEANQ